MPTTTTATGSTSMTSAAKSSNRSAMGSPWSSMMRKTTRNRAWRSARPGGGSGVRSAGRGPWGGVACPRGAVLLGGAEQAAFDGGRERGRGRVPKRAVFPGLGEDLRVALQVELREVAQADLELQRRPRPFDRERHLVAGVMRHDDLLQRLA